MRIDSAGNVGIGTSSPSASFLLNVNSNTDYKGLLVSGTGHQLIEIASSTSARQAIISFKNGGKAYTIGCDGDNDFTFYDNTANTERMVITSAGDVLIGKTTATANGGDLQVSSGITFPATQVAKSDANTLDDYEEGTFTPVLTGSTSGTFNGSGKYTKIGDVVNVYMQFTSITTANKPIGNYTITGLPFTSRATVPDATPLTIGAMARVTFDASKVLIASIDASATTVTLGELVTNGLTTAVTDANFVNGSTMFFRISGSYPTST
jgi:hypothetical protein